MASDDKTLNVLALFPFDLWTRKQSPSRREIIRALFARTDVTGHLTGLGFPDWRDNDTAVANINRIMPNCHAVLAYKANGSEHGRIKEIEKLSGHCILAENFNELWPSTTEKYGGVMHPGGGGGLQECREAQINLVIHHHLCDESRIAAVRDYGARLVHIPHGAAPVFHESSRPWSERSGILLTGSLGQTHYPLRTRWKQLIDAGRIKGRHFCRPPNYTASVEASDALVNDYANALGSCRVKLGCSSVWGYALQHISEAALAGCAHVCDLPDDLPDYAKMMHAVDPSSSDSVLVSAVEYAMEHAESIGTMAQATALNGFTTAHYAERLVGVIREML